MSRIPPAVLWQLLLAFEFVALAAVAAWFVRSDRTQRNPTCRFMAVLGATCSLVALLVVVFGGLLGATFESAPTAAIVAAALAVAAPLITAAGVGVYWWVPAGPSPAAPTGTRYQSADETAINLGVTSLPRGAQASGTGPRSGMAAGTEFQVGSARPRPGVMGAAADQKLPEPAYVVEQFPGGKVHRLLWETTIGRDKDSLTQISLSSPHLSGKHAAVRYERGQFFLHDLASKNGTYLLRGTTELRIRAPTPLYNGDVIRLAQEEAAPAGAPASPALGRGAIYLAFIGGTRA